MELREYESLKFELADLLRELQAMLSATSAAPDERIGSLFARLAEDRFNLAVMGRFSRGKTSLMNALLGMDRLPTGILPLTSVITSVEYSSREQAEVQFDRGSAYEIGLAELPDYVTERGNPGNAKHIARVRIGLPAQLLRRGFCFVDTPGLGSAVAGNAATTEAFLPEADAVVLVTSYEAPLSEEELRLARELAGSRRRVFLVLNKRDLATDGRGVEAFVRQRLAEASPERPPPLFSVSARDALRARLARDRATLEASGVLELEQSVTRFLIEDKHASFIANLCERIGAIVADAERSAASAALLERLSALRARVQPHWQQAEVIRAADSPGTAQSKPHPSTATANANAPKVGECPICRRVTQELFAFLCRFQYELARLPPERERLARAGGLCAAHLRLYQSMANERDLCLALVPLLQRHAEALREASDRSEAAGNPARPSISVDCPICRVRAAAERSAVDAIAGYASTDPSAQIGQPPPFLCLPHLEWLTGQSGFLDGEQRRSLLRTEAAAVEGLIEDMRRYALKRDGLREGLASEEELRAAKAAIAFLAGC